MPNIPFSVDAALLKELGERLVGKPHIALAELIKNSYDADATRVEIHFERDKIVIKDNGHGMSPKAFREFWMRIGSPHKGRMKESPFLKRPLTGSKGVGRLAVQFLASKIRLRTTSESDTKNEIIGRVNWEQAVNAGELTSAVAQYEEGPRTNAFAAGSKHGTSIVLTGLNHQWSKDELRALAREIWWLQPPFKLADEGGDDATFSVELKSAKKDLVSAFESQMSALLNLWHARLAGKLTSPPKGKKREGTVAFALEFADGTRHSMEFDIPDCLLHHFEFEVRIFDLKNRQRQGIKVQEARDYLNEHGGVMVYDAGFHLPYYGHDTDWLQIEQDHSHRLSKSKLLPKSLQVAEGLTHLPTNTRILGVVHVNSNSERAQAKDRNQHLAIQITRDRLIDNKAFFQLRDAVRWAVDFYAMRQAERAFQQTSSVKPLRTATRRVKKIEEILSQYKNAIPRHVREALHRQLEDVVQSIKLEEAHGVAQAGLLGALATAGISAIAFQHELNKQFASLEDIRRNVEEIGETSRAKKKVRELSEAIEEWISRARATKALFSHVAEEENRQDIRPYRTKALIDTVKKNLGVLIRGVEIDTDTLDPDLRLPPGTFAEWSSIFQNVVLNAVNAMVDCDEQRLVVTCGSRMGRREILFQDTGIGVDLDEAEDLFRPFVRKTAISPERRALGYGGTGLGLTIAKMIAEKMKCTVSFRKPDREYSTAFCVSWKENE